MEFIDETKEAKQKHFFRKTVVFIIAFVAASFAAAYFAEDFSPVADAFVNKIFESMDENTECTFFSDYTEFAKETVDSVSYLIESIKENFGADLGKKNGVSPVIFACAASLPVQSQDVTSDFGGRTNPISKKSEVHRGIDIAAGYGSAVMAAWPGNICETGEDEIYGKYVVIRHSKDFFTKYCHLSEISVSTDDFVLAGKEIGKAGKSGWATGSHLHFEVVVDGIYIDPRECLEFC